MSIAFEGKTFDLLPGETVLAGIERQGLSVPSLCRRGVCQSCVLKARRGALPALSQKGLKDSAKQQSFFLACVCTPLEDLTVERCEAAETFGARVLQVQQLSSDVLRVLISTPPGFAFEAGQFVHLTRPADQLMRPYSIASLPESGALELHVALLPGGAMSGWLRGAEGETVTLRGPFGGCVYVADEPERPLLLAGTGTGLAPLLGVLRAALARGHRGPIRLYHGSLALSGLYLWAELCALLEQAPQLSLIGSLLTAPSSPGLAPSCPARAQIRVAPLDELVLGDERRSGEDRSYLCGHPELVRKLEKKLYLSGASLLRIHADPFVAPAMRG
jgi:CDP-4-dehydro-6-deoxyglucose reductase, E3